MRNRNQLKLTIIGPGAMGCLLAAMLYKQDCPVSLLDYRPDRAERLKKAGIQVMSAMDIWTAFPNVAAEPESFGVQDWVIVFVKATQTADAVKRIGPLIGPGTLIVSLQNGLGHESTLSEIVKPEQIALGITAQGATLLNEGHIRHAGSGPTMLGLVSHKLIVNVGINALTALSGLTNGKLPQYPESLRLQELAVAEAWKLSLKKGIALGLSLEETIDMVNSVCKATAENRSSMLQDRIKNRPTEIDYINGAITGMGRKFGVATPVNEALTLLVRLNSRLGWKDLAT
jgi:2-dehydropantoate 2-reductase